LGSRHPLIDLRTLRDRTIAATAIASLLVAFGMYTQSLVLPQLFQLPNTTGYGQGFSMLAMACWYAPAGIAMMAASPLGSQVTHRFGAKTTLVTAGTVMACGYAAAPLLIHTPWGLTLVAIVCNVGTGLAFGAIPMLIMAHVPSSQTAAAKPGRPLHRIGVPARHPSR
jgi:MFS family permease